MIHKHSTIIQVYMCLVWTVSTVYGQCDTTLTATTTPQNQPAIVGSSGTCTWVIRADTATSTVKVQFSRFNLPVNGRCDVTNSIIVYDGDTTGPIIGLVCKTYVPVFTSSGSTITLRYSASEVTFVSAFSIVYEQRDSDKCGSTRVYAVSPTEYSIQSPPYTAGSQNGPMVCGWNIGAGVSERVLVTIETTSTSCSQVNAEIVTGEGRNETWCPGMQNKFMSSSSVFLDLEIHSGQSVKVKYRALEVSPCQQSLDATTQEQFLSTPNWPSAYPDFTECRWEIENSVRSDSSHDAIRLEIVNSDMEESEGCKTDSLQVRHEFEGGKEVLGTTCGTTLDVYFAYRKTVLVVFRSVRPSNTRRGVRLKYKVTAAEPCGGNLTASSKFQNVTSPGFPIYYPNYVTCVWTITAENPINYVHLEFVEMALANYGGLCHDSIRIYDGKSQTGSSLGQICDGNNHKINSLAPAALVVFKTNGYLGAKGFKMRYMEVEDSGPATTTIKTKLETEEFGSPRYPIGQIKNLDMTWTIQPTVADLANMLKFTEVDLGDPAHCSNNYIKIFIGNTTSHRSSTLCGNEKGVYMSSRMDGTLTVVMKTDSNPATRGFKASYNTMYTTVSEGCDGETKNITAYRSGKFTEMATLNYPNNYPNLANCSYLLESLFENYFMRVKIDDAAFADSGDCTKDYIELFDGDTTESKRLGKICTNTTQVFESTGRRMLIRMVSDANLADRGAKISYQLVNKALITESTTQGLDCKGGSPLDCDTGGPNSFTWSYILLAVLGVLVVAVVVVCFVYVYRRNKRNHGLSVAYKI